MSIVNLEEELDKMLKYIEEDKVDANGFTEEEARQWLEDLSSGKITLPPSGSDFNNRVPIEYMKSLMEIMSIDTDTIYYTPDVEYTKEEFDREYEQEWKISFDIPREDIVVPPYKGIMHNRGEE